MSSQQITFKKSPESNSALPQSKNVQVLMNKYNVQPSWYAIQSAYFRLKWPILI